MNPGTPPTDAAPPVCYICHDPADAPWADWIARQLADYQVPPRLVGRANKRGEKVSATIAPVHVAALDPGADLPEAEAAVLLGSRHLLVICSPQAARSAGIDACIRRYKVAGGTNHILAMVVEGEPNATSANRPEDECFPVALRHHVEPDGTIGKRPAEPIAADLRVTGRGHGYTDVADLERSLRDEGASKDRAGEIRAEYVERQRLGRLKVVAGLLGITLGELTERDKAYQAELDLRRRRQARRRRLVIGVASLIGLASAGYAAYKAVEASNVRTNIVTASVTLVAVKREYSELSEREQEAENNLLYQRGLDMMARAPDAAMACLRTPASRGHDPARHALGMALVNRGETPEALAEGVQLVRTASANGFVPAMADMARLYQEGEVVPVDKGEALRLATAAAEKGSPAGISRLGCVLELGWGGMERQTEGVSLYQKAAKLGDPVGLYSVHFMYKMGVGVSRDPKLAEEYLQKAIDGGSTGAINTRANKLLAQKRRDELTSLLKLGSDLGNRKCMSMLGLIHKAASGDQNGNIEIAEKYLRNAAIRGEKIAAFALGTIYEFEYPTGQKKDLARRWLTQSADGGDSTAAAHLALLHFNGIGGPVDKAEGLRRLRQAMRDPRTTHRCSLRMMFGMLAISGSIEDKEAAEEAIRGYNALKSELEAQRFDPDPEVQGALQTVDIFERMTSQGNQRSIIQFTDDERWIISVLGETRREEAKAK